MKSFILFCGALLLSAPYLMAEEDHDHEHEHDHAKPQHGGVLLESSDHALHLEVVYDEKTGTVRVWVTGADGKTPLQMAAAPRLNATLKDGKKQFVLVAVDSQEGKASQFTVTDETLKTDPENARFAVVHGEKTYQIKWEHEHEHDHDHE